MTLKLRVLIAFTIVSLKVGFAQDSYDNLGSSEKELVIFENSGHSPMSTEPYLFAEEVIEFINQNK